MIQDMEQKEKYYSLKCGLASFIAKYAVGIFHPLELLKTRFQSNDGKTEMNNVPKYNGIVSGLKTIYYQEGFSGLYKGVHITVFVSALANACFFWFYEKKKLQYEQEGISRMYSTVYASIQSSLFTTIVTQPFWVVKTRVILNTQKNINELQNIKQKIREIWSQGKFKGYTRGLSLNMFLSIGGATRMFTYEGAKLLFQKHISKQIEGPKHFVCGGISKAVTTLLSYPFTTVRTRIQQNQVFGKEMKYKNIRDIFKKIIKHEGVLGFYKGLVPNLIRGVPMRSVYFYAYQFLKSIMIDRQVIERRRNRLSSSQSLMEC